MAQTMIISSTSHAALGSAISPSASGARHERHGMWNTADRIVKMISDLTVGTVIVLVHVALAERESATPAALPRGPRGRAARLRLDHRAQPERRQVEPDRRQP